MPAKGACCTSSSMPLLHANWAHSGQQYYAHCQLHPSTEAAGQLHQVKQPEGKVSAPCESRFAGSLCAQHPQQPPPGTVQSRTPAQHQ